MKMSNIINDPALVSTIPDLARGIKSEADLSSLTRELCFMERPKTNCGRSQENLPIDHG
jgi:hypothetical protein